MKNSTSLRRRSSVPRNPSVTILPLYNRFPCSCSDSLWLPERYLALPGAKYPRAQFIVRYATAELAPRIPSGSYLFLQTEKDGKIICGDAIYYFASDTLRGLCTAHRGDDGRIRLASLLTDRVCVVLPPEKIRILCRVRVVREIPENQRRLWKTIR